MKGFVLNILGLLIAAMPVFGQLREVENPVFEAGEELTYVLRYGILTAGEATLKVKNAAPDPDTGRERIYVEGIGKTTGTFSWFFKVYDYYASIMDAEGLYPVHFRRRINEGSYKKEQDYYFDPKTELVKTQDDTTYKVPKFTQDMLSSFYYARTLNFDTAKVGDVYTFPSFVDNKIEPIRIKFLGKDFVDSKTGKYRVLKFSPAVVEGNIFEDDDALVVYISDDKNRVVIMAEAEILVGSIKMELKDYKNLKHPMAKVPKR